MSYLWVKSSVVLFRDTHYSKCNPLTQSCTWSKIAATLSQNKTITLKPEISFFCDFYILNGKVPKYELCGQCHIAVSGVWTPQTGATFYEHIVVMTGIVLSLLCMSFHPHKTQDSWRPFCKLDPADTFLPLTHNVELPELSTKRLCHLGSYCTVQLYKARFHCYYTMITSRSPS